MRRSAVVALLIVLAACGGEDRGRLATEAETQPFPSGDAVPGWQRSGERRTFTGPELYSHINGGSEIFLELGFDHLEVQAYTAGEDELSLEIYSMRDPAAAFGIYLMKSGAETPDPALPFRHTISEMQLQLVRGPTYLSVVNLSGGPAAAEALMPFAVHAAEKSPAGNEVAELALLDPENQLAGSLRIIRGPFTLEALYTLGEGDILRLSDTGTTAVAADYGHPDAPETFIVADYGNAEVALQTYALAIENLDSYLEVVEVDDYGLVFKDWQELYGWIAPVETRIEIWVNLQRHPSNES